MVYFMRVIYKANYDYYLLYLFILFTLLFVVRKNPASPLFITSSTSTLPPPPPPTHLPRKPKTKHKCSSRALFSTEAKAILQMCFDFLCFLLFPWKIFHQLLASIYGHFVLKTKKLPSWVNTKQIYFHFTLLKTVSHNGRAARTQEREARL